MYREVLRRAVEAGYRRFDFGRSKAGTGAFNFKRHWGFEPEPLFYEHRLFGSDLIPERNPLNPKYATAMFTGGAVLGMAPAGLAFRRDGCSGIRGLFRACGGHGGDSDDLRHGTLQFLHAAHGLLLFHSALPRA